jgi:hypothetical protein
VAARVVNLGPLQRRRRLVVGIVGLSLAIAIVVAVMARGSTPGWTLAAFPLFWLGALGLIQAREKT